MQRVLVVAACGLMAAAWQTDLDNAWSDRRAFDTWPVADGPQRSSATSSQTVVPADRPRTPKRGFFMGTLATPALGQSYAEAHAQLAEYGDWVPVWHLWKEIATRWTRSPRKPLRRLSP